MQSIEWVKQCKEETGMTPSKFVEQFNCDWNPELIVISEAKYSEMQKRIKILEEYNFDLATESFEKSRKIESLELALDKLESK